MIERATSEKGLWEASGGFCFLTKSLGCILRPGRHFLSFSHSGPRFGRPRLLDFLTKDGQVPVQRGLLNKSSR